MNAYKFLVAAAVALVLALVLACGGDDEDAPSPGTPTPPDAPDAAVLPAPVFSCADDPVPTESDAAGFPVTITDDAGRSVTVNSPPEAIASLSSGHTEILYAIGAGGNVIAVDAFANCPDAVTNIPQLDAFTPSLEAIVDMEPDLVVLFFDPGDLIESLEGVGVTTIMLASPTSVEDVYRHIELLGEVTGHPDQARGLVDDMRGAVGTITAALEGAGPCPTVYHELDNIYFTAGPGSFIGDLYSLLGAQNIADATGEPFPQLSAEAIIAADPEVIVLADEAAGESPETVRARAGWSGIDAVQNDRIHVVDPDVLSRPGPRVVDALITLARILYPEHFE